jgi:hypothetical protein
VILSGEGCILMGLGERLLYSSKFLGLLLFTLYLDYAVITYSISNETIIYGTVIAVIILLYFTYYSLHHRSLKEVFTLVSLIAVSIILGAITGLAFGGYRSFYANAYTFSLSLALILLIASAAKLIKV